MSGMHKKWDSGVSAFLLNSDFLISLFYFFLFCLSLSQ